jgi:hypothetical protein
LCRYSEAGCTKMELLAIDDGNEYAAKLVNYYRRLGFEAVRVVGENGLRWVSARWNQVDP